MNARSSSCLSVSSAPPSHARDMTWPGSPPSPGLRARGDPCNLLRGLSAVLTPQVLAESSGLSPGSAPLHEGRAEAYVARFCGGCVNTAPVPTKGAQPFLLGSGPRHLSPLPTSDRLFSPIQPGHEQGPGICIRAPRPHLWAGIRGAAKDNVATNNAFIDTFCAKMYLYRTAMLALRLFLCRRSFRVL